MQTIDSKKLHLTKDMIYALSNGETFALTETDELIAFIVPALPAKQKRPFGLAAGEFKVSDDFNEPLTELEEATYN